MSRSRLLNSLRHQSVPNHIRPLSNSLRPDSQILEAALKDQTGLALKRMWDFGKETDRDELLLSGAQFLHREIPIRLARLIKHIDNLPFNLPHHPRVSSIRERYVDCWQRWTTITCPHDNASAVHYTCAVAADVHKFSDVVQGMQRGVIGLGGDANAAQSNILNEFLNSNTNDPVVAARILESFTQQSAPENVEFGDVGRIRHFCNVKVVAEAARTEAIDICSKFYTHLPAVRIHAEEDVEFQYVGDHLRLILLELLKNSIRATCEFYPRHKSENIPPVRIVIVGGEDDVSIKVADKGGGVSREDADRLWQYNFTTQNDPDKWELAGSAEGLPLTRLYAQYFGGELDIMPMCGHGTDAYLHLPRVHSLTEFPYEFNFRASKWLPAH